MNQYISQIVICLHVFDETGLISWPCKIKYNPSYCPLCVNQSSSGSLIHLWSSDCDQQLEANDVKKGVFGTCISTEDRTALWLRVLEVSSAGINTSFTSQWSAKETQLMGLTFDFISCVLNAACVY